jgi:hypothetical protein
MRAGRIAGEIREAPRATQQEIMALAVAAGMGADEGEP